MLLQQILNVMKVSRRWLLALLYSSAIALSPLSQATSPTRSTTANATPSAASGSAAAVTQIAAVDNAGFTSLVDTEGNPIAEDGLPIGEGKWTLVMLWATSCHVCKEQKPKLSVFHDEHKNIDAQVYGIALDGHGAIARVKNYMKDHNVSFPTFIGEPDSVLQQYQVLTENSFRGTPTYLLFDPSGELKGNNAGAITMDALVRFMERHKVASR